MEAFSWETMGLANLCGFIAIVVLPWLTHLWERRGGSPLGEIESEFFLATCGMWIITPIVGILFAADTPSESPLWVGQLVMAFLTLYITGGVMGFISLMIHYSVMERIAVKRT